MRTPPPRLQSIPGLVEDSKRQRTEHAVRRLQAAGGGSDRVLEVLRQLSGLATQVRAQAGPRQQPVRPASSASRAQPRWAQAAAGGGSARAGGPAASAAPADGDWAMTKATEEAVYAMNGVQPRDINIDSAPHSLCYEVVEMCAEVGMNYQRIREQLNTQKQNGFHFEAFRKGVRSKTNEVEKYMGEVSSHLSRGLSPLEVLLEAQQRDPDLHCLGWIHDHVTKSACGTGGYKGGGLVRTMANFVQHPTQSKLANHLSHAASLPTYKMVVTWLTSGKLEDPHKEFFVEEAAQRWTEETWWAEKYRLTKYLKHPPFISADLAHRILLCGKGCIFLQLHGGESFRFPPSVLGQADKVQSPMQLERFVAQALGAVNGRVMSVMRREHHMVAHLQAARCFALLTEGDFFDRLVEELGWWLSMNHKDAATKLRAAQQVVGNVLRKTPVIRRLADISAELHLRVKAALMPAVAPGASEPSAGDLFVLEYSCEAPMNIVLPRAQIQQYRRLCHLLWRLRRLRHELVAARPDFSSVLRCGVRAHLASERAGGEWWRDLCQVVRKAQVVEGMMLQFLNSVLGYMLIDGVDVLWNEFERKLQDAEAIDSVTKLHQDMLNALETHFLLDADLHKFMEQINDILGTIHACITDVRKLRGVIALLVENFRSAVLSDGGRTKGLSQEHKGKLQIGDSLQSHREMFLRQVGGLLVDLDKGLDPRKRDGDKEYKVPAHMGCLQRLRTVLDFGKYIQSAYRELWDRPSLGDYSERRSDEARSQRRS
eukprot:TRINITY_DN51334_c0_g1_i1.p1 TRINITY_DN51334_c0_g1~~TRINITY_DN51334_c0_g1_i1.p1  ORF type:complete len:855 (+),score=280.07 TRINITY_DN51334_c0_g1_i1:260-2566(+)